MCSKTIYEFENFRLDAAHLMLYQNEQEIALAPKVIETLLALVKRHGEILSKDELMELVWTDSVVEESNLTQNLYLLRSTLGKAKNGKPLIETFRRRGYRFNGEVKIIEQSSAKETTENVIAPTPQPRITNSGAHAIVNFGEWRNVVERAEAITETQEAVSRPTKAEKFVLGNRKNRFFVGAIVAVFLIIALGLLIFIQWRSEIAVNNAPIDSIAVLPFENATQDPNLEYLSDGITENVINNLSRLSNLRVLPRSTVFYYKGNSEDPHTIGQALSVKGVLTGKVEQHGDTLIIQTELIDVDRKAQIWGQQYNRPFTDVINLQEEISRAIIDHLRLKSSEPQHFAQYDTDNSEAYKLYLKANFFLAKRTAEDYPKAIENFREAIAKDPNYARAYAGLSEAYTLSAGTPINVSEDGANLRINEANLKSKEAALRAMELDPNSAEVNTALGVILLRNDWNWSEAERLTKRAIELDPNYESAHRRYGELLSLEGRNAEAIEEMHRALELEPLSLITNRIYGETLLSAGRTDEAISQLQKTIDMDAYFWSTYWRLGWAYEAEGMYADAIAVYVKVNELVHDQKRARRISDSFAKNGWQGYLRDSLKFDQERSKTEYVSAWSFANLYAKLGEREETFSWLEKAYQAHEMGLITLKRTPAFQNFKDDPRYEDLLRRIGLQP